MITIRHALERATSQLSARPELRDSALADAVLLLMHTLGVGRATLRAYPERTITTDDQVRFQALLQRRLVFEPIQYILGEQEFFGLPFAVGPAVLIPRPETETLVEAVLARVPGNGPLEILDVGTGSGAIAVALAHALPHARVTAIDLSEEALAVARSNAARLGVRERVEFAVSDLLGGLAGRHFDVIAANPPYVPEAEAAGLHPQVRLFEPHGALFAGADGMSVYRRLIPQARAALRPAGLLALEIGFGQREPMEALLTGWTGLEFLDDLQGIARVALARA